MRTIKMVVASLMAAAVFTATVSATASAALPEFQPTPNEFSALGGKGTLTAGIFSITCTSSAVASGNGKITGPKLITATLTITGCEVLGQKANSLGDGAGVVLVEVEGEACYISKLNKEAGIDLTVLPESGVHIELPSLKELLTAKGAVVLKATPVNKTVLQGTVATGSGVDGVQCEGKESALLVTKQEGTFEHASESTIDEVFFFKEGVLLA